MLIRKLIALSIALVVMIGSLSGCKGPDAKTPPKKPDNTTQGKK